MRLLKAYPDAAAAFLLITDGPSGDENERIGLHRYWANQPRACNPASKNLIFADTERVL